MDRDTVTEHLSFSWSYYRIYDYLATHDTVDFSDFNDTIHFEIQYTDGTVTTVSVELLFSDAGEATAVCGDYTLSK